MVDYEVVSYIDSRDTSDSRDFSIPVSELTFNDVYPSFLLTTQMNVSTHHVYYRSAYVNNLKGRPVLYPSDGDLASAFIGRYGTSDLPILAYQLTMWSGTSVSDFEICYYAFGGGDLQLWRLTSSDVKKLGVVQNPWGGISGALGDTSKPVFWLYNVGSMLLTSLSVSSLLTFKIGGNTFFWLMTTGFLVYAGWVIVKFVIP